MTGVDSRPQPNYPFNFYLADAMAFPLDGFDYIHASPPCQGFSITRKILEGRGLPNTKAVDLIRPLQDRLFGRRYIIENVIGALLRSPFLLCGTLFNLKVYRHRIFESFCPLVPPLHLTHRGTTNSHRGYSKNTPFITVSGHNYNVRQGKEAMGISWMTRDELNEAIPPAYTEWIGRQLLAR